MYSKITGGSVVAGGATGGTLASTGYSGGWAAMAAVTLLLAGGAMLRAFRSTRN